jgi:hypothetical protein
MHTCAFCRNTLKPLAEWKGSDGSFYCNEFCAETEGDFISSMVPFSERLDSGATHERR